MDLETMGEKLLKGEKGEAIRNIAASEEARRLGQSLDPAQVERIARSGDGAQLKALLQQVLSTPDGRALAEKLSGLEHRRE